MNMTKKQIIYTALSAVVVIVLATAGALALRHISTSNEDNAQQENASTANENIRMSDEDAEALISEAEMARTAGNYDSAKASYLKAQVHYKEVSSTEKVAELDAILSLVEVEKSQAPIIIKAPIAGEQ